MFRRNLIYIYTTYTQTPLNKCSSGAKVSTAAQTNCSHGICGFHQNIYSYTKHNPSERKDDDAVQHMSITNFENIQTFCQQRQKSYG